MNPSLQATEACLIPMTFITFDCDGLRMSVDSDTV